MFYTNKVLFVHIPKTGGDWLTQWAKQNLVCSVDIHYLKHASYPTLIKSIPELQDCIPFSIIRSEQERRESYYKHAVNFISHNPPHHTKQWQWIIDDIKKLSKEDWLKTHCTFFGNFITPEVLLFPFEYNLVTCIDWLKKVHA